MEECTVEQLVSEVQMREERKEKGKPERKERDTSAIQHLDNAVKRVSIAQNSQQWHQRYSKDSSDDPTAMHSHDCQSQDRYDENEGEYYRHIIGLTSTVNLVKIVRATSE